MLGVVAAVVIVAGLLAVAGSSSRGRVTSTTATLDPFDPFSGPGGFSLREPTDHGFRTLWTTELPESSSPTQAEEYSTRLAIWGDTVAVITETGRVEGWSLRTGARVWVTIPSPDGSSTTSGFAPGTTRPGTGPGSTAPDGTTPDGTTPDGTTPDSTTPDGTTPDRTPPTVTVPPVGPGPLAPVEEIRASGGGFFVVLKAGRGYAIDPESGRVLWSEPAEYVMAGPSFPDAFFPGAGGMVHRGIDAGEPWTRPGGTSVTVAGEVAAFGDEGEVKGADRRTGEPKWTVVSPVGRVQDVEGASDVVLVLGNGSVAAVAASDGATRWTRQLVEQGGGSPGRLDFAAITPDVVYIHDFAGTLSAVDVSDGKVRWTLDDFEWDLARGRAGEVLLLLADSSGVGAFDREDGALVAELTASEIIGPPATDGQVACYLEDLGAGSTTTTRRGAERTGTAVHLTCVEPG